jgi:hypothetical protein
LQFLNGKESTVNIALGGSTYPGEKLVRTSLCKIFFSYYETQQLILGTGTAIWWVTEPHCIAIFKLHVSIILVF